MKLHRPQPIRSSGAVTSRGKKWWKGIDGNLRLSVAIEPSKIHWLTPREFTKMSQSSFSRALSSGCPRNCPGHMVSTMTRGTTSIVVTMSLFQFYPRGSALILILLLPSRSVKLFEYIASISISNWNSGFFFVQMIELPLGNGERIRFNACPSGGGGSFSAAAGLISWTWGKIRLEIFSDDDYDAFIGWRTQFEGLMKGFFGNLIENDDD